MNLLNISIPIYTVLLIISISALFNIKYNVNKSHIQLEHINIAIKEMKNTLNVLEAEWSYLTQPVLLERLTKKYLDLQPILYSQAQRL